MVALSLLLGTLAHADGAPALDDRDLLAVLPAARACAALAGGFCASSASASTAEDPATPLRASSLTRSARRHTRRVSTLPAGLPTFSRRPAIASLITSGLMRFARAIDELPWAVEIDARLRRHAYAGNAFFLIFDAEDPGALERREVTAFWQADVPSGSALSARLILSPNDGFHAHHAYLLRIVQLVAGRQVLLAEGAVQLR